MSNRLMVIICSRPPVCAALALIGACSLASNKNVRESVEKQRDIAAFEVVALSKLMSAYRTCCALCCDVTMFPELMISLIIS